MKASGIISLKTVPKKQALSFTRLQSAGIQST